MTDDADRPLSADLKPGTQLSYNDGYDESIVTLARRKEPDDSVAGEPYRAGWWLLEGGGLADDVIDAPGSPWVVVARGDSQSKV